MAGRTDWTVPWALLRRESRSLRAHPFSPALACWSTVTYELSVKNKIKIKENNSHLQCTRQQAGHNGTNATVSGTVFGWQKPHCLICIISSIFSLHY